MPPAERPAPLMLVVDPGAGPGGDLPFGSDAAVAHAGQGRWTAELWRGFAALGCAVAPLPHVKPPDGQRFHWGRWFGAGARAALAAAERERRAVGALGDAAGGAP